MPAIAQSGSYAVLFFTFAATFAGVLNPAVFARFPNIEAAFGVVGRARIGVGSAAAAAATATMFGAFALSLASSRSILSCAPSAVFTSGCMPAGRGPTTWSHPHLPQ